MATVFFAGASGCVLVMDSDYGKYEGASEPGSAGNAGSAGSQWHEEDSGLTGGSGGSGVEAGPDAFGGGGMGGVAGRAGFGGTGGGAGLGGAAGGAGFGGVAGVGGVQETCDDGIQNQGETGVDCGGPCPLCVRFLHTESFNAFPQWGPDGAYKTSGLCASDDAGWGLTDQESTVFQLASGYYAAIFSNGDQCWRGPCEDSLLTPELDTKGATSVTVRFDSSFRQQASSTISVLLKRDGVQEKVWSKTSQALNEHLEIGPLSLKGATRLQVYFRYQADCEYYWKVDNVEVEGN